MSKGLGKSYLTTAMINYHLADVDNRMYINLEENKKAAMPRYFKDKIYNEEQRMQAARAGQLRLIEKRNAAVEKYGNDELERLKQEATIVAWNKMYKDSSKGRDKI